MKLPINFFLITTLFLGIIYGQESKIFYKHDGTRDIDPRYHTYEEVVFELDSINATYPNITRLDSIGVSTTDSTIIWAMKVSDNPLIEEDEPAVLYNGVHHAEELLGAEICMYMINDLVTGYGIDPEVTSWVDSTEIWLVPIVNPDGHEIVMTDIDTIWRKNTRDNNENDTFDLDYDGVDLNRNYDFNWETGGSTNPSSEYYRGPYPFSELETQAMRNLSEKQNFIFAVNYHGARTGQGEVIYYPWTWSGQYTPDHPAISEVADSLASLIVNDAGTGTYEAIVASATLGGLTRHWQYGAKGAFGFTVEVSTSCAPPGSLVNNICERNLVGAYYLLDRVYGSSIIGCITDSATGEPLEAEVRILEAYDPDLPLRLSDSTYGRYRRILIPGTYTVEVSKEGYPEVTISDVEVFEGEPTILNIQLPAIPVIVYYSHTINDSDGGNGDGFVNPGESILMPVTLKNTGNVSSYDVTATLRTDSNFVIITDSVQGYGDILPESTATSQGLYVYTVSPLCPNGYEVPFSLFIEDTNGYSWVRDAPEVIVVTAEIDYESHNISDPSPGGNNNGELDPGETANIMITVHNSGPSDLADVHAVLRSTDPWLIITDSSSSFGDIRADSSSSNYAWDYFTVSVSLSMPPGHTVEFTLHITGDGGTYSYEDTSNFSAVVGEPTTQDPTGPDEYGYYAYDDTDTLYGNSPTYDWFGIASPGPGSIINAITNEDADTVTLVLPFIFKYYGEEYDSVGVCSNGFLELGSATYRFGSNAGIPDTSGPRAMVAPFWDDLDPSEAGDIYQYYDGTEHRWIIEFYNVDHYGGPNDYETFQVILYDPAYYPTPTGDGEVVYQYHTVGDATSNTVGIEDHTETVGIQWVYNNTYEQTAAPLVNGRAIKFTTNPPVTAPTPWVYFQDYAIDDSAGGNNNGMPGPDETVELTVFLANGGDSSANNVQATLRSSDPDITILDSLASFGDISAGGQGNNASNPYSFMVASAPSDTLVDFSLLISANQETYQTVAYFTVKLDPSVVGVSDNALQLPIRFDLLQNYPNPMSTTTRICYQLPKAEKVRLKIYNVVGRLVNTLVDALKEPGYYTVYWNGEDGRERKVSGGVYFYRIQAGDYTSTKKMILLR